MCIRDRVEDGIADEAAIFLVRRTIGVGVGAGACAGAGFGTSKSSSTVTMALIDFVDFLGCLVRGGIYGNRIRMNITSLVRQLCLTILPDCYQVESSSSPSALWR